MRELLKKLSMGKKTSHKDTATRCVVCGCILEPKAGVLCEKCDARYAESTKALLVKDSAEEVNQ